MDKKELENLVLDHVNTMNVMSERDEKAKLTDYFGSDLWFDSLDDVELTTILANELKMRGFSIPEFDIEYFWDGEDKTVQQLVDYLAEFIDTES